MKSFKGGVPAPVCHCQIISQIIPLNNAVDIEAPLTDCIPLCSLPLTAINLLSMGNSLEGNWLVQTYIGEEKWVWHH